MTEARLIAANVMESSGLTKAGRSLQKHGGRANSLFPEAIGNPQAINKQANAIVNNILNNPNSTQIVRHHKRFGDITDIYAPNGQGLRFDSKNNFIGFIEKGNQP